MAALQCGPPQGALCREALIATCRRPAGKALGAPRSRAGVVHATATGGEERAAPAQGTPSTSQEAPAPLIADPEAQYRRYGANFGKRYTIDLTGAPQIRVRKAADRQRDQIAELAVLNERLAGNDAVSIRKRVEYIRAKRRNWQAIYDYVSSSDAAATLAMIEEANAQVSRRHVGEGGGGAA